MRSKLISAALALTVISCVEVNAQNNSNLEKKQTELSTTELPNDSVYYTCSMHPEFTSAVPGNCPKCGMTLVKKSNAQENPHQMQMKGGMMKGMGDMEGMDKNNNMKSSSSEKQDSVVYSCSMHPKFTSDKPGNCPKCGMTLEKQKTSEGSKKKQHKMKMSGGMM